MGLIEKEQCYQYKENTRHFPQVRPPNLFEFPGERNGR
jgi:hypothetical protein